MGWKREWKPHAYRANAKYPDVFLRSESHPVKFPLDDKTKKTYSLDDSGYVSTSWYWTSCYSGWISIENVCNGLLCSRTNDKVYINPEIVEKSNETLRDSEGCLSAPGKQGDVKDTLELF